MPGSGHYQPMEPGTLEEESSFDLVRWIHLLWEHRWWIVGVTGLAVILAALYSFLATPIYSATASVYVRSFSRQPMPGYNPTGASSWMEEQKFYSSQSRIIKSQPIMEEAADKLGLSKIPVFSKVGAPWRILEGATTVKLVRDSAIFTITVSGPYKDRVADWANTIADVYREKALKDAVSYIAQANRIMLSEAKKMQEEYVKQQGVRANDLKARGAYFPKNQKDILDKRIETLELKLNSVAIQASEIRALVVQLQRGGGGSLPVASSDSTMQDMTGQYNGMVRELAKLEAKFTPRYPSVKVLKARIVKQRQVILSSYQNQLSALMGERTNLQADLDAVQKLGLQSVEMASRGEALSTSLTAIRKYMDLLYDKMKELNISSALLNSNIRMVNPAHAPSAPVRPKKAVNILLGFFLGLMVSVGSVVAYQYLDVTVRTAEDVETKLGSNLLSFIPSIEETSTEAAAEAFQTLRIALTFASDNRQKNLLLFTSPSPQEGKTTVVVNLAKAVAEAGERVLLVDCDLRRPSVARQFNMRPGKRGLTRYLAERSREVEDDILPGPNPNLFVLPSGPIPPNPPELFSMQRFGELFEKLRQKYDWIFLDSPPVLAISDAQILAGLADLVIFVARYKKTKRPVVERSLSLMRRLGVSVAGIVLNDIKVTSGDYYDYYYGNYYYETGSGPDQVQGMLGRVAGWKDLFRRKSRKNGGKKDA